MLKYKVHSSKGRK